MRIVKLHFDDGRVLHVDRIASGAEVTYLDESGVLRLFRLLDDGEYYEQGEPDAAPQGRERCEDVAEGIDE